MIAKPELQFLQILFAVPGGTKMIANALQFCELLNGANALSFKVFKSTKLCKHSIVRRSTK